jgi:hypothetical protein
MKPIEGGCLCGAVRYTASREPIMTRACWCRVCQYFAAGNATINMVFPTEAIQITGSVSEYTSSADSGNQMHRQFCSHCGVQLFSRAEQRPHIVIVRAGTLDNPTRVKIDALIWTDSAPKWVHLDPSIPHFPKQPPAPQVTK